MSAANDDVAGIYKDRDGKYVWVLKEDNGKYLCMACENGIEYSVGKEQFEEFVFLGHWESE